MGTGENAHLAEAAEGGGAPDDALCICGEAELVWLLQSRSLYRGSQRRNGSMSGHEAALTFVRP